MSSKKKLNDAAADLWNQLFSAAAKRSNATMEDPDYDRTLDDEKMRKGFLDAGWKVDEIELISKAHFNAEERAPITSPGASRAAEAYHDKICNIVEMAMERKGLTTHRMVSRGIEPKSGPSASKINVIMTDQSIITVNSFTYRYCGLIAKAFTRTLRLNPWIWESPNYDRRTALNLIFENTYLIKYWVSIYLSFSLSGTNFFVPFKPCQKSELFLMEQIARAMEVFMVAHEYGHHHHNHGRLIEGDFHAEEYEADQFALKISRHVGDAETPLNPYLASGAGGVILLKSLATLKNCEVKLGAKQEDRSTHPPVGMRVSKFDYIAILQPNAYASFKSFRKVSSEIMDIINDLVLSIMESFPSDLIDSFGEIRGELTSEISINK